VASGEILPPGSCPDCNHTRHSADDLCFILASSIFKHSESTHSRCRATSSDSKQCSGLNTIDESASHIGTERIRPLLPFLGQRENRNQIFPDKVSRKRGEDSQIFPDKVFRKRVEDCPSDPKAGRGLSLPSLRPGKHRLQPSFGKLLPCAINAGIDRPAETLHRSILPSLSRSWDCPHVANAAPFPSTVAPNSTLPRSDALRQDPSPARVEPRLHDRGRGGCGHRK
jgi:hypothetical protein